MHESSLASKVVAVALEEVRRRALQRVGAIRLRVGALWGSEPESLAFHASLLARGTPLADATLEIETVPVVARCHTCGKAVEDSRLEDSRFLHALAHGPILVEALLHCVRCGSDTVVIEHGRELEVREIVERVPDTSPLPSNR